MEMCVKARQSHRHREMLNPAPVPERDEITVNSSFPRIIHSHGTAGTASWFVYEGSLRRSSAAGHKLGHLPAVIRESHTLFSV